MSMFLFLMKYHLTSFALTISDMNDIDYYYYYFTTVFLQYTHHAFLLIILIYCQPYLFTNINMLSMIEIGSHHNVAHIFNKINKLSMSMLLFLMKYHLTSFALIISDMNDVDYYYYFYYCISTIHT